MTKRIHPAQGARTATGVVSALALVGIVTSFQLSANAQEGAIASGDAATGGQVASQVIDPATGKPVVAVNGVAPVAEAVPAPVAAPGAVAPAAAPGAVAPVAAPAAAPVEAYVPAPVEAPVAVAAPVAAPAPAPAPVAAPVNGTTAGSGG